jgi:hypothetical protein
MPITNTGQLDPTLAMYQSWGQSNTPVQPINNVTGSFLGYNQGQETNGNQQFSYNPASRGWDLSQVGQEPVGMGRVNTNAPGQTGIDYLFNGNNGQNTPSTVKSPSTSVAGTASPYNTQQNIQKDGTSGTQNPWGSLGSLWGAEYNWQDRDGGISKLPEWLRKQFIWNESNGEGSGTSSWQLTDGQVRDRNGNQVYQIGQSPTDYRRHSPEGGYVKDPSKLRYDEDLGWVADQDNWQDGSPGSIWKDPMFLTFLAITGAGMGLQGNLGSLFGGGEAAGGQFAGIPELGAGSAVDGLPAMTEFNAAGAGAGATAGAATGGGSAPFATLPEFVSPATTLPEMSAIPPALQAGGGAATSILNNPLLRTAASTAIRAASSGGNSSGGRSNSTGTGTGEGGSLTDWLTGILSAYQGNRNIQSWREETNNLMNRGDYNSQYRPGYLASLNESYTNPDKFLAPYAEGDARDQENMRRKLDAKGYNMSGNELGELTKLQGEQRYRHMNDYRNDIRSSIQLGHPEQMASAALRNLPGLFAARTDRDAGNNAFLQRLLGGGSNSGGGSFIQQLIRAFGGGGGEDIPPFAEEGEFVSPATTLPEMENFTPEPVVGEEWWNWL